jgi:pimeloyl-ACP methyl ester carboxylesterase
MFHDDLLVWLEHVREALGLTSFFLGGMSYGGLLTLRYAAKYPERVKRIALMAPGGLLSISLPFMWRALPILLYPRFGTVYPYMAWASVSKMRQEDAFYQAFFRDFVAQMALGFQYGRSPKMSMPTKLSDDLLRQVQAPCLLLLGEQEKIYPPRKGIERAQRLIPSLQPMLLPEASHDITIAQRERVSQALIEFFKV